MSRPRVRTRTRVIAFVLALFAVVLARPAMHHARAASLLMTFSDKDARPAVEEERFTFAHDGKQVPARLFLPAGAKPGTTPAVVLVHGVHRLGIEEPRLERFARAIAESGVVVMTPAIAELSDYKVAPQSIDTVGDAIEELSRKRAMPKVGLMGTSFGGGIALLTAADARFADRVSFVVAVGAHDDLERVSHFFVENKAVPPDGAPRDLHAHGYGMLVLVYAHAEDFFPPEDLDGARDAIRLFLWEEQAAGRKAAERVSPASKAKLDKLLGDDPSELRGELLAEIDRRAVEMKAVSPHGHLGGLRAPVYLLHGAGDTVVPATETLWLAKDVPPALLRTTLVSPAIQHVELKSPTAGDQIALVHFMGQVLAEADR